jgi:hypothetical protein
VNACWIPEQRGLEDVALKWMQNPFTLCTRHNRVLLENSSLLKNIENMDTLMRRFWPAVLLLIFSLGTPKIQAQETGPLLMQQELGYTLAGTVAGVGLGVLVWFMDPLNPDVTLRDTTVDGLIVGTLLGSMFGFYILQNALVEPRTNSLPSGLEDLLGQSKRDQLPSPVAHTGLTIPMTWKF